MPGCVVHSRPKLAEKARYNLLLKIKVNNNNNNNRYIQSSLKEFNNRLNAVSKVTLEQ